VSAQPVVNPTVAALNALQIYDPDQAAAYREHARGVQAVLGADFPTRLSQWVGEWAGKGGPAALILTGNAGTGKTAAAEAYCAAVGAELPLEAAEVELAAGRFLVKDLSDFGSLDRRGEILQHAWEIGTGSSDAMSLVAANEGMLRGTLRRITRPFAGQMLDVLDRAMAEGAAVEAGLYIVNVNRQRPTSKNLWGAIVDYMANEVKWSVCIEQECPARDVCPMRLNAAAWRRAEVSEAGRSLMRLASGAAVPTLREVLSLLSWAITSRLDCETVQRGHLDLGRDAFSADRSYYHLFQGGRLEQLAFEQSPLLSRIAEAEIGGRADIQVDSWLRDQADAPEAVIALAEGSAPQGRVTTSLGRVLSYARFGAQLTTSEDSTEVSLLTGDLVDPNDGVLRIWRRAMFFGWPAAFRAIGIAFRRLSKVTFYGELTDAMDAVRSGGSDAALLMGLISGLNYLATGIADPGEGLIVPDTGSLFARDPGAFRPVGTSLVQTRVPANRLSLAVEDQGLILDIVDWDDVRLVLEVDGGATARLPLTPRLFQALREAAEFRGPTGSGVAEMAELQSFYASIAQAAVADDALGEFRVVDPEAGSIRTVVFPGA
jgi:hypothetical protein